MGVLITGKGGSSQKPIIYGALQMSSSLKDVCIPVFWGQRALGTNAIWYNDFKKHHVSAKGGKGGGKGQQYDYTAAVELALSRGVIDSIQNVWPQASTTSVTTLSALNMTLFDGAASQAPPSFITTKYPTQARNYNHTAYLFCPKLDLGQSATIPDNRFECVRANGFPTLTSNGYIKPDHTVTPAIDVLFADVIPDYLTNAVYGLGFVSGDIGSTTSYRTYNQAQGLYFSPCLKSQEKVTTTIDRWAQLSNTWIYWSGTTIMFVPLGDAAVTGNGATYTPDLTPAYNLGPADFLDKKIPVKPNIVDPSDVMNRTAVAITDRTIGYTNNPIEWKDQTLVDLYGLRDNSSIQADEICNPDVGKMVAQLIGKRAAYIQRTYTFKTSYRFILCLPGTLLTITEPNIGLNNFPVRVKEIEEADDGTLSFTCEEFPGTVGTVSTVTGTSAATQNDFPNNLVDPGNVNTPAIIEPNSAFTNGKAVLIVAASGGPHWGGADVYLSFDPTGNGNKIGSIYAPAIQGVLTAPLANHADPDTVDTLSIDATESQSEPTTVTHADADALRTLSLVVAQPTIVGGASVVPNNGELLAFGNVAATGTYTANLTYLRRGQYGTAPAAHSIGDQFTTIDVLGNSGSSLTYDLPPQYIGQTLYVRFVSFNSFQAAFQDISTVVEYQYTPTGAGFGGGTGGVPTTPTGLAVSPGSGQNVVSWASNPITDNVTSYQLWAASGVGAPFSSATKIWQGSTTNYVHTGLVSGSAFTYFLIAVNQIGSSAHTAGVSGTSSAPPASVPPGGTTGQPLVKNSNTDYDTVWSPYADFSAQTAKFSGALAPLNNRLVPTTGFAQAIPNNVRNYIVDPAGTLASGTLTMPTTPVDGQELIIEFTKAITALTVSPAAGQTLLGAPTSAAANTSFGWVYRAATTTWYVMIGASSAAAAGVDPNIGYFCQGGLLANGLLIGKVIFTKPVTFPKPSGDISQGGCRIAPTGSVTFPFIKNASTNIGSVAIASGATVATFTVSGSFVAGDTLSVFTPTPADATLQDVWFNVVGSL